MLPKSALIDLTYSTLCFQVNTLQQQRKLTNEDIEVILTRILQDVKGTRLIEAADTILQLEKRIEELEKGVGENDKPNNQS